MDFALNRLNRSLIESSPLSDELWNKIYGYSSQEDCENMKLSSKQLYYVQSKTFFQTDCYNCKTLKMLYKQIM